MLKAEKIKILEQIEKQLQTTPNFILADYRGLTVEAITNLRDQLREQGMNIHIIKNSLLRIALERAEMPSLGDTLTGPSSIVWVENDPVTPAKILKEFSQENENLELKGGLFEGQALDPADVVKLAGMPTKDLLYSQILYGVNSGATRIAMCLKDVAGSLVRALEAHRKNLEAAA